MECANIAQRNIDKYGVTIYIKANRYDADYTSF